MIKSESREEQEPSKVASVDAIADGIPAAPESQATMNSPGPVVEVADSYLGAMIDNRYLVEERIGEGGMGVVYRCRHTSIDKRVAMKVLRSDMARSKEAVERFVNEARSASAIGNPHIIDISDFGRLPDGAAYFVMEFLEGTPLVELAESGVPLSPARVAHIALQLTEGLAAAHRAGIIHRDLKPDNIFLVKQGAENEFVKILDFGIAKVTASTSKLTQAGQIFGTPHYMSPEQADGARIDERADIYALGVILYELLTGTLPFDAENSVAVLTQHIHRQPTPPSELPDLELMIPPAFEALVLKCLAKRPSERFQSMSELGQVLEQNLSALSGEEALDKEQAAKYRDFRSRYPEAPSKKLRQKLLRRKKHPLAFVLPSLALVAGSIVLWMTRSPSEKDRSLLAEAPNSEAKRNDAAGALGEQGINPSELKSGRQTSSADLTTVSIEVFPAGAHVFAGEVDLGPAPLKVRVGEHPASVQIRLAGYAPETLRLDDKQSTHSLHLKALKKSDSQRKKSKASQHNSDLGGEQMPSPWDD